ncbi:hypothetical protein POTOM_037098 [Populus tomentosa]|uniref:RanBP2-type domain-containing protein n=1 Tax=Populus tomentosa TaxID=118781 RepID=A0A8X7Z1Y7_POPTO|nr:hypothetical protein POTOM_037098 [Populus tomentosa]
MDLNDLNKVWEIEPLKMVGEEDAKKVLEKVAKQAQPIMKKRKWKVKVLSEFCPVNPALTGLNIGGGAEVCGNNLDWDLYKCPVFVMVKVSKLLEKKNLFYLSMDVQSIDKECEELMAKGITGTGQGFGLPGRRLGPKHVGGDNNIKAALSPIQAAAMAAERRLHDDLWCGSKSSDSVTSIEGNVGRPEGSSTSVSSEGISAQTSPMTSMSGQESIGDHPTWQCNTCTLLNQPMALICEACGTQRHKDVAKFKVWFGFVISYLSYGTKGLVWEHAYSQPVPGWLLNIFWRPLPVPTTHGHGMDQDSVELVEGFPFLQGRNVIMVASVISYTDPGFKGD